MVRSYDADIEDLEMSEPEKSGIQVYRNYSKSFNKHRLKVFAENATAGEAEIADLIRILEIVETEYPRILLVFAAAYADKKLEHMLKREIEREIPGGHSQLFNGFGPLSRLAQRLQVACAFGWLSRDLIVEIDHIRKVRNDISHHYDGAFLEEKIRSLVEVKQNKIEELLTGSPHFSSEFYGELPLHMRLRVRLVWLMGRWTYETSLWVPALKAQLQPSQALYGECPPAMLASISGCCVDSTKAILLHVNE